MLALSLVVSVKIIAAAPAVAPDGSRRRDAVPRSEPLTRLSGISVMTSLVDIRRRKDPSAFLLEAQFGARASKSAKGHNETLFRLSTSLTSSYNGPHS